jgi:tRNA threonylcarbamoyladenosine biosynthesis protein TsaB
MTVTLGIETSQRAGGVALRDRAGTVHEELIPTRTRHDDELMSAVERLFAGADLPPSALEAVGVSVGPGGFTGLRIAVATAKMLALALGCRVIAVESALVVAESLAPDEVATGPVLVALAAKRGTFWATRLVRDADGWSGDAGALADAETVALDGLAALAGDEHLPDVVRERCAAAGVPVVTPRFEPRACLAVAERMDEAGRTVDPHRLLPIYPRPPEAVRLHDRRDAVQ